MLGIVSALAVEAKVLTKHPISFQRLSGNILLAVSGAGPQAAQESAELLVSKGATSLVSWGCAGALVEELAPGDLLLPEAVTGEDGQVLQTDSACRKRLIGMLPARLKLYSGMFVESSCVLTRPEKKRRLAKSAHAIAVDMESAAVGRIAQAHGIPFIVIRSVVDTANDAIPDALALATDTQGNVRVLFLLKALLRKPGICPQLVRQGLNFRAAAGSLRMVANKTDRLFHLA